MVKRFALLAALAAVFVTFAGSAGAITGNYSKDFKNDFVGLLVFYTAPDANGDIFSHRCSGSLLSDRVTIVTAGHCTEGVDTGRVYFQQAAAPNYSPAAFGGLGGDETTGYPYTGGTAATSRSPARSASPTTTASTTSRGIPTISTPVWSCSTRLTPPRRGRTGSCRPPARSTHTSLRTSPRRTCGSVSSGYGLSDQDPRPVSFRERLTATAYLVNWEAPVTAYNLKTTANASQGKGGTCNGDSGGPIFCDGHAHHRGRHVVRHERPVQGSRLLVPARPARGPRLDQRPESSGRRLGRVRPRPEGPLRRALGVSWVPTVCPRRRRRGTRRMPRPCPSS